MSILDALQAGFTAVANSLATGAPRLLLAMGVFVLGLIIADVGRRAVFEHLSHRRRGNRISIGLAQIIFIAVAITAALVALSILGIDPASLVAGLGLTSLAIGFAMRDILENTTAGLLLSFTQPFSVGDWIRVGDVEGAVVDMTVHATRVKTASGTEIRLPNRTIYTSIIENKTAFAERRLSLEFPLPPGSDPVDVCALGAAAAATVQGVLETPSTSAEAYIDAAGALHLRVYFWVDSRADPGRVSTLALASIQSELRRHTSAVETPA